MGDGQRMITARRALSSRFYHEHFQLVFAECFVVALGRLLLSQRAGDPVGVDFAGCAVSRSYRIIGYLVVGVVERNFWSTGVAHLARFFADGAAV